MQTRREMVLSAITGLSSVELRGLNRVTAAVKRVVNMTKKGKMWVLISLLSLSLALSLSLSLSLPFSLSLSLPLSVLLCQAVMRSDGMGGVSRWEW